MTAYQHGVVLGVVLVLVVASIWAALGSRYEAERRRFLRHMGIDPRSVGDDDL